MEQDNMYSEMSQSRKQQMIEYEEHLLDETISQQELNDLIKKLNQTKEVNGILLQSPLPEHLDINQAFKAISYRKDVDGFTPSSVGKLVMGGDTFISCTPYRCYENV